MLVVADIGIDAIADAAGARHHAMRQRRGNRHAGGPREQAAVWTQRRREWPLLPAASVYWRAHEQHHVGIHRRIAERRVHNVLGSLREGPGCRAPPPSSDSPGWTMVSRTDRQFVGAILGQRNIVRVGSDRTIVVIRGHGGKRSPFAAKRQKLQPAGWDPENFSAAAGASARKATATGRCFRLRISWNRFSSAL